MGSAINKRLELSAIRADGSEFPVELTITRVPIDGPPTFTAFLRDITERKETGETLRRQNAYLTALHETSLGVLNHLDLTELLQAILAHAGTLLGTPDGLIFWLEDSDTELPTRIGIGAFREDTRPPVRRGEGLIGTVWKTGERLVLNDYQQWPERRTGDKRDQIHAAVAVPLLTDGQVIGVISLVHLQPARVFSDDELELLTRFAHLAEIALHNARLYAQTRTSEARYRDLIELSPAPIIVHSEERFAFANAAALKLHGVRRARDLVGKPVYDFVHPASLALTRRRIRKSYAERRPSGRSETMTLTVGGETLAVETVNMPISYEGKPATLSVLHDITERKKAERQLRESEERYRLLFDSNPLPMWVYDWETLHFLAVNDAAISHYGYSRAEFLTLTTLDIRPPEEIPALHLFLATHMDTYQPSGIWRHKKKDGALVDMEVTSYALEFEGRPARLVVANDVTERQRAEEALRHHALHDALTGLPNRTLFAERLARALARAERDPAYRFAVLYLDFDRFKTINDSLGHLDGDQVLIEGAHRLAHCMRPQDTLARFGGDEFVVLLEELAGPDDSLTVADCLNRALGAPISLRSQEVWRTICGVPSKNGSSRSSISRLWRWPRGKSPALRHCSAGSIRITASLPRRSSFRSPRRWG
ncbi:MAG: PAS domain S-box protein [Thermomicrobia bacterium]|nr:PAS domain S-box protein [Thermomicrobia bacterium]